MKLCGSLLAVTVVGMLAPEPAFAGQPSDSQPETLPPSDDPLAQPPSPPPITGGTPPEPVVEAPVLRTGAPSTEELEKPMSEGRQIVVAWNTGFQWGLSPGVIIGNGQVSFALALRLAYGFDTGTVLLVPGVRLAGYFSQPAAYLGMPVMKLVLPLDRFAPFVEGGAGAGYVGEDKDAAQAGKTGLALLVGGGFMVHFTMRFGLGVEANYQLITGTSFKGFGVGPILALAF